MYLYLCTEKKIKNLPFLPFTVLPPFFTVFTGLPFFSIYRFYRFTVFLKKNGDIPASHPLSSREYIL